MLEGDWAPDLERRIGEMAGPVRQDFWGGGDTAKNIARSIVHQLSTLYNSPAQVNNDDAAAVVEMTEALRMAGYWELMQGFSPLIIGQREGLTRAEIVDRHGKPALLVRTIPADLVFVESDPDNPDVPTLLGEFRPRKTDNGWQWVADVFDLRTPGAPVFHTLDEEMRPIDVGIPAISGDAYTARWSFDDGTPFIPGEWVHAARTGKLRDPKFGMELFRGALTTAGLWTLWSHIIVDCSHPQRYTQGLTLLGAASGEGEGKSYVVTDPSSVLQFGSEPGVPTAIGQWAPGGDPVVIGDAIRAYSSDLAVDFDISPSDIQRASGDARSGFAIFLTKEGQRHAQRRYKPSFRRHDTRMVSKMAAMLNRSAGASLPEVGWDVHYRGLPLGLSERAAEQDEIDKRLAAGTISKVDAVMQRDHISREAAITQLQRVAFERAQFP